MRVWEKSQKQNPNGASSVWKKTLGEGRNILLNLAFPTPPPIIRASRFKLRIIPELMWLPNLSDWTVLCLKATPSNVLSTRFVFGREMESEVITPGAYIEYISAACPLNSSCTKVKYYEGQEETYFHLT